MIELFWLKGLGQPGGGLQPFDEFSGQCDINNRNIHLKPEQDGFCSHGWLRELCEYYPRHARLEEFRSDLIKGQNDMLVIRLSKLFAGDKKSE